MNWRKFSSPTGRKLIGSILITLLLLCAPVVPLEGRYVNLLSLFQDNLLLNLLIIAIYFMISYFLSCSAWYVTSKSKK